VIDPASLLPEPPVLATRRLRLRPLRVSDAEPLFAVFSDAETMRWWSSPPHDSPTATLDVIERARLSFYGGDGIEWAITAGGDDRAVGKIGHWRWQRAHSRSEVGFILRRDLWRRGLMSEALRAVIDWGFAALGLHSVEAQLDIDNLGSRRTLERAGFRQEGVLRQSYFDGRDYRDTLVFGLLAGDRR
jgi:ribosomal-protein-alanine N-acetyltransferase